jgi:colanic acid/amylovoran biosynthesis glycosyltransferase
MYDWPGLAVQLAVRMGRKFDLELDVDHIAQMRLAVSQMPPGIAKWRKTRWANALQKSLFDALRRSNVALLQGKAVFDTYKGIASNPHKVLNVQVTAEDRISMSALEAKVERSRSDAPINVVYAGRATEFKGPLEWLAAVHQAVLRGARLQAKWLGEGPLMPRMKTFVEQNGLGKVVSLPGVVGREQVLEALRNADIFLFCHQTDESPRCLVEALASGCPIVGFDSAFPRGLVEECGGAEFVTLNDIGSLASTLTTLYADRDRVARLQRAAAASGQLYDREPAIERRIELIKRFATR